MEYRSEGLAKVSYVGIAIVLRPAALMIRRSRKLWGVPYSDETFDALMLYHRSPV